MYFISDSPGPDLDMGGMGNRPVTSLLSLIFTSRLAWAQATLLPAGPLMPYRAHYQHLRTVKNSKALGLGRERFSEGGAGHLVKVVERSACAGAKGFD